MNGRWRLGNRHGRILGIVLACLAVGPALARGEHGAAPGMPSQDRLGNLISQIAADLVPDRYVDERKWGGQKEFTTGLHVKRDGLRITTKRKKKPLNHGTWKRYEIRLLDPDRSFRIHLTDVERLPEDGLKMVAHVDARLALHGRVAEWRRGVQLFSISANAQAVVKVRVEFEVDADIDATHYPPHLVFQPVVRHADVDLIDFRLERISDLHGPVVRELGDGLERILADELDDRRAKLVTKINRLIEKNRDDLEMPLW